MCLEAITCLREQDIRPSGCKFVALALADHADANWTCFPSVKRLAFYTSLSDRSVRTHLKSLVSMGVIHRQRRRRMDGTLAGYTFAIQRQKSPRFCKASGKKRSQNIAKFAAHETPDESSINNNGTRPAKKRTAIPSGWRPDRITHSLALQKYGFNNEELKDVIEDFIDFWDSKRNSPSGRKRDWNRTFRLQLRRLGRKNFVENPSGKTAITGGSRQGPADLAGAAMRRALARHGQDDVSG